ncbi:MAG: SRPBCC domain-containing protein [Alphaproteobacteria bacterium]|nr:SRPBCC domain-containing protein [Alphaproteobacteria bacterium]MBV9372343.1 SRPBCC domain-containing protein [Alphaproteobacteria bacterium]MBV9899635.1 SRPBCC domain-containing protein [Alphaproteobacteria bacterium]
MRIARGLAMGALALAAAPAAAGEPGSWRDFPGVENSSFVEPNGDRALQLSIVVPAPARAVFDAFATTEGFRSWAVPVAKVDLRVGGSVESSYNPSARLGDRDNIRNEIVAYVPGRTLVLRNVQAPRSFVDPDLFQKTVTIVEFEALGPESTRVTVTNAGYGPGERFDRLYRKFEWGDAYTLAELRARFVKGPADWSKAGAGVASARAARTVEGRR